MLGKAEGRRTVEDSFLYSCHRSLTWRHIIHTWEVFKPKTSRQPCASESDGRTQGLKICAVGHRLPDVQSGEGNIGWRRRNEVTRKDNVGESED